MAKFYTGFGDTGKTAIGSKAIDKTDILVQAIGEVDELNAAIGVVLENLDDSKLNSDLLSIQDKLFIVGAQLASAMDMSFTPKMIISQKDVEALETNIAVLSSSIGELNTFILPGGSKGSAYLDLARAIARRAERSIVAVSKSYSISNELLVYTNRLSSLLFVAARYLNKLNKVEERKPKYE